MQTAEGQPKLKPGNQAKFRVIEFNKDAKKLVLSHRMTWDEELQEQQRNRGTRGKSGGSGAGGGKKKGSAKVPKADTTTLGEISALAQLKQKLEAEERERAEEKLRSMGAGKEAASTDSEDAQEVVASNEEE